MAGDGANTQTLDGLMKDIFEDFIAEAVNQKNPLKDVFKRKVADIDTFPP